ncbi:MAG: cytochrome b/b6 domain-containing protein, partial [Croceibacterium sp.]
MIIADQGAQARYSGVAIALHWVLALTLAFQLALGFAMPRDASGFALFQLHKSVGITVLVLTLVRIGWRIVKKPPPAVEGGLGGFVAKAVHVLLYVFMIGAPLTGWALVSTAEIKAPTVLFGTLPWPHLPLPDSLGEPMEEGHELLAWLGIALIVLHILGALRHQFLIRDNLMRRMSPGGVAALGALLGLGVLAVYFGTGMTIASQVVANGGYKAEPGEAEPLAAATPAEATATPTEEATAEATETPAAEETPAGPPPTWTIRPGGRLSFSVGNGAEGLRGSFSDWSGAIKFDPEHPDNAPDIRISVKLASANMGDATQDGMLQDGEFFATSANPVATFRSTSVEQTGPGRYRARGTLSLK